MTFCISETAKLSGRNGDPNRAAKLGLTSFFFAVDLRFGTASRRDLADQLHRYRRLYAIGLADLVYAKLPSFRHGVLTTFGPSHIPRKRRLAYYRGYTRIAFGAAFNLLVVLYYSVVASLP